MEKKDSDLRQLSVEKTDAEMSRDMENLGIDSESDDYDYVSEMGYDENGEQCRSGAYNKHGKLSVRTKNALKGGIISTKNAPDKDDSESDDSAYDFDIDNSDYDSNDGYNYKGRRCMFGGYTKDGEVSDRIKCDMGDPKFAVKISDASDSDASDPTDEIDAQERELADYNCDFSTRHNQHLDTKVTAITKAETTKMLAYNFTNVYIEKYFNLVAGFTVFKKTKEEPACYRFATERHKFILTLGVVPNGQICDFAGNAMNPELAKYANTIMSYLSIVVPYKIVQVQTWCKAHSKTCPDFTKLQLVGSSNMSFKGFAKDLALVTILEK